MDEPRALSQSPQLGRDLTELCVGSSWPSGSCVLHSHRPSAVMLDRAISQPGWDSFGGTKNSVPHARGCAPQLCPCPGIPQLGCTHRVWDQISLSRMAAVVMVPV